jgi:hypothetical protein
LFLLVFRSLRFDDDREEWLAGHRVVQYDRNVGFFIVRSDIGRLVLWFVRFLLLVDCGRLEQDDLGGAEARPGACRDCDVGRRAEQVDRQFGMLADQLDRRLMLD